MEIRSGEGARRTEIWRHVRGIDGADPGRGGPRRPDPGRRARRGGGGLRHGPHHRRVGRSRRSHRGQAGCSGDGSAPRDRGAGVGCAFGHAAHLARRAREVAHGLAGRDRHRAGARQRPRGEDRHVGAEGACRARRRAGGDGISGHCGRRGDDARAGRIGHLGRGHRGSARRGSLRDLHRRRRRVHHGSARREDRAKARGHLVRRDARARQPRRPGAAPACGGKRQALRREARREVQFYGKGWDGSRGGESAGRPPVVTGIAFERQVARVAVVGVPVEEHALASIFSALAIAA